MISMIINAKRLLYTWLATALAVSCGYTTAYFMLDTIPYHSPSIIAFVIACGIAGIILNFKLYLNGALALTEKKTTKTQMSKRARFLKMLVMTSSSLSAGIFTYVSMNYLQAPPINTIACTLSCIFLTWLLLDFNPKELLEQIKSLWNRCNKLQRLKFIILNGIFIVANAGLGFTTFDTVYNYLQTYIKSKAALITLTTIIVLGYILAEISFALGVSTRVMCQIKKSQPKKSKTLFIIAICLILLNAISNAFMAMKDWGGIAIATCGAILSAFTMYDSINKKSSNTEINPSDAIGHNLMSKIFLAGSTLSLTSILACAQYHVRNIIIWLPTTLTFTLLFGGLYVITNKPEIQPTRNASETSFQPRQEPLTASNTQKYRYN